MRLKTRIQLTEVTTLNPVIAHTVSQVYSTTEKADNEKKNIKYGKIPT